MRKILSIGALRTRVDSNVLLLIIEVKVNFSLGFDNTDYQTNKFVCLLLLLDETIRTSLFLSQKIICHIGPNPWLVSGLLSSHIYGTYCNAYTVQCNVSTDSSLFVGLSRLAKPKQRTSLNEIFSSKLSI